MFGVAGLRARGLFAQRGAVRLHFAVWSALLVIGHVAGGALAGGVMGWAGASLSPAVRRLTCFIFLGACLAWSLPHLSLWRYEMPQWRRQVQRYWMQHLPWSLVAIGYGLQLGCGFATYITVNTIYAAFGLALLSGSATAGATVMSAFALARSALPVVTGLRLASPESSLKFAATFDRFEPVVLRLNGVALILTAVLLAARVLRPA